MNEMDEPHADQPWCSLFRWVFRGLCIVTPAVVGITSALVSALVLSLWLLPGEVLGNAGPPTRGVTPFLVKPVGIKDVEIVREHLSIDLRGFASGGPARPPPPTPPMPGP